MQHFVLQLFFIIINKYGYFIKVYFMKLLDVNEYAVTKLANRIMLLTHLVLETACKWPFMCYPFYVSAMEMFI